MNYRKAVLLEAESIATAATKTIDLDLQDLISRITLFVMVTNTSYIPAGHPADCITLIEIVDGSEVLYSLTGVEAQALSYYNNGVMDRNELNYENVGSCRAAITLNFGRYLYDELFALDPNKYRNLQLRVTHNKALGGCTPTAGTLKVTADLFDEKVAMPGGFLSGKEIFGFTPVAGAAEYIIIPTDQTIRMLMPINTNDNEEPDIEFETIKIDEDNGKRTILDCATLDLINDEANMFPCFTEFLSGRVGTGGEEFYVSACKDIMLGVSGCSGNAAYYHGAWSGGRLRSIKGSATYEFSGNTSGRCPHGGVPIFFGKRNEPDDWWDVSRIGQARVILTPRLSSTDGNKTTRLVGQFARKY